MDVFDNAKGILQDSRERSLETLRKDGIDATSYPRVDSMLSPQAYDLGVVRALDLAIACIDGAEQRFNEEPQPEKPLSKVFRTAFLDVLISAKDNFADTLENVADKIKDIDL
jgi:hypothetical protein